MNDPEARLQALELVVRNLILTHPTPDAMRANLEAAVSLFRAAPRSVKDPHPQLTAKYLATYLESSPFPP